MNQAAASKPRTVCKAEAIEERNNVRYISFPLGEQHFYRYYY